jgi:PTH1 family peptidyl-tRNA hydrolase
MHLVVGLGNPGSEYRNTRHNAGFMVAERLRVSWGLGRARNRYQGRWCEGRVEGRDVALLTPATFMNASGESVKAAAQHKHIPATEIIVIHDDMDFPFGTVRVRSGGGAGGHNGLRSIVSLMGTEDFIRVRVGIGRPDNPFIDSRDWVLSDFDQPAGALLPVIDRAAECVRAVVVDGLDAAMNRFNRRDDSE